MKKTIILAGVLFLSISINAQSLLWKVSGNGLKSPSYIFGTHHLAPLSILDKVSGFKDAFNSTTQVVGELNMKDAQSPESVKKMQEKMFITNDTTAQILFNDKELETINAFLKTNMGFDLSQAPKIKPAFVSMVAAVFLATKALPGYNPKEQLDGYFQTKGEESGKKVLALETMEFQRDLLYDSQSLQRQARLLVCVLSDTTKEISNVKELTEAYYSFDLEKMDQLSKEKQGTSCDPQPGENELMIDNRNKDWATKLPAIMKETPSFIAVGALHLPGKAGLIALLKKQGFKVEPVK
ncbi:TraB/GumN family protein [uncultured Bacteroides sp.]|uniref:TraB/GumN family protein n=1 Tax=uncultured Bacteroides sp. TaxID=162156 RepID=UPI002AABD6CB|nr:TraB/GumN family protein [uncultured Bacteroides sp.]